MTSQNHPYIPFQTLIKAKQYKILNYGQTYDNYTRFQISENPEFITDIYVDCEPYIVCNPNGTVLPMMIDESTVRHQVEIHYSQVSSTTRKEMRACILTNAEIDELVARYGCRL